MLTVILSLSGERKRSGGNPVISVTDELGDSIPQYNTDDEENEAFDNIPALINADHLQKTVLIFRVKSTDKFVL